MRNKVIYNTIATLILLSCMYLPSVAETYVVSVGIADYKDPQLKDLVNTEKDAHDMALFYERGTRHVKLLIGNEASKANILRTLEKEFSKAGQGDRIVFFFSGHGYAGGFCPYDITSKNNKIENALSYAEVLEVMKRSKASDKLIFADACNSGAIRSPKKSSKPQVGNVMFFLSSRTSEKSRESPLVPNGFFTKYLLRGLAGGADKNGDRIITASELFRFVSDGVRHQSNDRQHPVMWGNFPDDFIIVKYQKPD